ncbi:MAG: hypothetical protein K6F70_03525 [Eggerthellaceae bacterium]|nr:hypothetical protein [Eggerthellaceae bacterium]
METFETDEQRALDAARDAEELHAAARKALADIRTQSGDSTLVTPARWTDLELAPTWMDTDDFAEIMLGIVRNDPAWAAPEPNEEPADVEAADAGTSEADDAMVETAGAHESACEAGPTTLVGTAEDASAEAADATDEPAYERETLQAAFRALPALPHEDIQVLEGAETAYLYSSDYMTDTYANWAFLALEDDKVRTFVYVVREDSRVYPRPMIYKSLLNPPFSMTEDDVLRCWQTVQETNDYPDIASCTASNGDVYFYSTDFLSDRYAQSLAEYESVERLMCP